MQIIYFVFLALLFALPYAKPDLFVGAGGFGYGCGSNSPATQLPYSFVRLGPDTTPKIKKQYARFQHYGGYSTGDDHLRAFSHLHLVGAGVIDMGIFGILPQKSSEKKPAIPNYNDTEAAFFKTTEHAEPGFYSVVLQDDIEVELTTTQRCGAHRYTFHKKGTYQVDVMSGYLLQKKAKRNSTTYNNGNKTLSGSILVLGGFGGRFGGYTVHYYLRWVSNSSKETVFTFNDTTIDSTISKTVGQQTGAVIQTDSHTFEIYIGLSYVSIQNAKNNLETQIGSKRFDTLKNQSLKVWKEELSRFQITAISEQHQTKIDTAIYRTLLTPTLFNDANGDYLSFRNDGSVSKVPANMKAVYTDMSIWDVHRTQMPWLLFQDLDRFNDIAKSLLLFNKEGGYMPKWPFAQGWTGCMIGSHSNTILADWIVKQAFASNLTDSEVVLEYMLRNANTQTPHDSRPNPQAYLSLGYIAAEGEERSSCSQTLEIAYNDYGIGQVASLLGKKAIAEDFQNRSTFYKNVWNPNHKFFEPKYKNKTFIKISSAERLDIFSKYYVEGNAWHYRFYAPHDAKGLIELFGGEKEFVKQLRMFFSRSVYWPTFWLPNPYYWAGNEHDLFSVWLFNYANRSDLTQRFSRMIIDQQYGVKGDGLPGNDDYATMSAWLVWASLGFYPLPSTKTYVLGSPTIHSARIYRKMGNGILKPLNINVLNNKPSNHYVKEVGINGRKIQNFISHDDMKASNSQLIFQMK